MVRLVKLAKAFPQTTFYGVEDDFSQFQLLSEICEREGFCMPVLVDVNMGMSGIDEKAMMLRVLEEVQAVKAACGERVLKVIIETCLLTREEKVEMCRIVTQAGADFIKTSTGFSTGGATPGDVGLLAREVGPGVRVKAAGGISSWEDAEEFIRLGASRLGTSRLVKLAKAERT